MSGKLFAFNVSKMTENSNEKANAQWVGNPTANATYCGHCYCSGGQGYGLSGCTLGLLVGQCWQTGSTGYYLCDAIGS